MVRFLDPLDMGPDRRVLLGEEFGEEILLLRRTDDEDGAGVRDRLSNILEERLVLLDSVARAFLARMEVANDMVSHHRPVRLVHVEMENARLLVVDPHDGMKMLGHRNRLRHLRTLEAQAYRARLGYAMTRFMRKNGDSLAAIAAAEPDKAAVYAIGDDESGMRLDRWLHRRFPSISNSHLMKIVRKGEVRVSGRRADVSTRLAAGESVRVPPLRLLAGPASAI